MSSNGTSSRPASCAAPGHAGKHGEPGAGEHQLLDDGAARQRHAPHAQAQLGSAMLDAMAERAITAALRAVALEHWHRSRRMVSCNDRADSRHQGAAAAEGHQRLRHDLRRRDPVEHRPGVGDRGAQGGGAPLRDQGDARGRVPRAGLPRRHRQLLHRDGAHRPDVDHGPRRRSRPSGGAPPPTRPGATGHGEASR